MKGRIVINSMQYFVLISGKPITPLKYAVKHYQSWTNPLGKYFEITKSAIQQQHVLSTDSDHKPYLYFRRINFKSPCKNIHNQTRMPIHPDVPMTSWHFFFLILKFCITVTMSSATTLNQTRRNSLFCIKISLIHWWFRPFPSNKSFIWYLVEWGCKIIYTGLLIVLWNYFRKPWIEHRFVTAKTAVTIVLDILRIKTALGTKAARTKANPIFPKSSLNR